MNGDAGAAKAREHQDTLRRRLAALLRWETAPPAPAIELVAERACNGYTEQLIHYANGEGEVVPAYLLRPPGTGPFPGVVVHHQHSSERHVGKSEVAGRAGDPQQALGPPLARRGCVVLAPDAACFEDRRRNGPGTEPRPEDFAQHYNEFASRLVRGSLLMSLVLADAALAVSVLAADPSVDARRVGALGHSMGGHTTLFSAALDARVAFAAVSGAAGSYRSRIEAGTGIELAQVIPGIAEVADFPQLAGLIAPRPLLLVSATEDRYSRDAEDIAAAAGRDYARLGAPAALQHRRHPGGHALTPGRVQDILDWVVATAV